MSKLVRLYPYNKRLQWVMRSYTLVGSPSLKFRVERGWYEVDDKTAKKLEDVLQQSRYPNGPKAFLIAKDAAEAKELDEKIQAMQKKDVEEPTGTADTPVRMHRPGAKATTAATDEEAADEEAKPKTRRRRRSAE